MFKRHKFYEVCPRKLVVLKFAKIFVGEYSFLACAHAWFVVVFSWFVRSEFIDLIEFRICSATAEPDFRWPIIGLPLEQVSPRRTPEHPNTSRAARVVRLG